MARKRYSRKARAIEDSDRFLPEQVSRLRGWAEAKCPALQPEELEPELDLCLEYHRGRGTLIKDLEASAREWLLRGETRRRGRRSGGPPGLFHHTQRSSDPRTADHIREGDETRRRVESEDPEERAKAIQAARDRPWRHRR
jgi:hypothetical protein